MQLMLPQTRYPDADAMTGFYRRLRDELRALPGATATAISTTLPLSGSDIGVGFTVDGRPADPSDAHFGRLLRRQPRILLDDGDPARCGAAASPSATTSRRRRCVIVSEAMAAKYWPGEDPIGKRITIGYNKTGPREIVGVAGDVKQGDLTDTHSAADVHAVRADAVAVPGGGRPHDRGAGGDRRRRCAQVLARLDPQQAAGEIRTLEEYVSRSIATPRFTALLVGSFAGLALLLAGFGLYGVMAYSVAQRRREIGIRMALGAQAARRARAGRRAGAAHGRGRASAIGLAGALFATRVLDSLLFGVTAGDPLTFAAVSAALVTVLLLAAYLPARRATRVDPMVALRTE